MSVGVEVSADHTKHIEGELKATGENPQFCWWVEKVDKKGKIVKNSKRIVTCGQLRFATYKEVKGNKIEVARTGWLCDVISINADNLPVVQIVCKDFQFGFQASNSEEIVKRLVQMYANVLQGRPASVTPPSLYKPDTSIAMNGFANYFKSGAMSLSGMPYADIRKICTSMTQRPNILDLAPLKELEPKVKGQLLQAVANAAEYNTYFTAIESRYVESKEVCKAFAQILGSNTALKSFMMMGTGETKGYDLVGKAINSNPSKALTDVNISRNLIGDKSVLLIVKGLATLPNLLRLNVSYTDMKSKGVRGVVDTLASSASNRATLQRLDISQNKFGGKSGTMEVAQSLSTGFPSLHTINFTDTGLHLQSLGACLSSLPALRTLNLSKNSFSAKDANGFDDALAESSVTTILLGEASCNTTFICTLAAGLCVKNDKPNTALDLHGINLGPSGGAEIAKVLKQSKNFSSLNVNDCALDCEGLEAILDSLWECTGFRHLYAARNIPAKTKNSLALLDAVEILASKVQIETIVISGDGKKNYIPEGFGRFFQQMQENTNRSSLRFFDVAGNKITDDDAVALGDLIHKTQLVGVAWDDSLMEMRGLRALSRAVYGSHTICKVGAIKEDLARLKGSGNADAEKEVDAIVLQAKKNQFHADNPDAVREAEAPTAAKEAPPVKVSPGASPAPAKQARDIPDDDPSKPFMHWVTWCNETLKACHEKNDIEGYPATYFEDDFRDGILMIWLLEVLGDEPLDDYKYDFSRKEGAGARPSQYKLINLRGVFKKLTDDGHDLGDVEPVHVLQGKRDATATVLQIIKDNYIPLTPEEKEAKRVAEEKRQKEEAEAKKQEEEEKKRQAQQEAEAKQAAMEAERERRRKEEEEKAAQGESLDDLMSMGFNI